MSDELKRGSCVGEYIIDGKLGQGGFGITYRAVNRKTHETVVVKEYFPKKLAVRQSNGMVRTMTQVAFDEYILGLRQFYSEAKIIAEFDHLNVIRILHAFKRNGTAYIITRYEHGMDLSRYMYERLQRPLNYSEIIFFFIPILGGLCTVHKKGFLHLDIKPGNILIRKNSSPCLIDFGGASHYAARESYNLNGNLNFSIATDGYSPPEQYSTNETEKSRGPEADVYALGATIYSCMAGEEKLKNSTNRLVSLSNLQDDPVTPAVERFRAQYPQALLELVDSCHAIRKDLRPKDAEDVRHRLIKIVNDEKRRYEERQLAENTSSRANMVDIDKVRGNRTGAGDLLLQSQNAPSTAPILESPVQHYHNPELHIESQPPQNKSKSVDFSIFSPANVNPNQKFILYVWAYLEEQLSNVHEKSSRLNKRFSNLATASGLWLRKGTNIIIILEIEGINIINNEKNIYWNEKETNVSFPIHIPKNTPIDDYFGLVRVICSGIEIACIDFTLSVTNEVTDKSHIHQTHMRKIKSAFISYSRKDTADVFRCKQGMEVIAPDIDFFLDVKSLRSGDNWEEKLRENIHTKEKFLLFWSKNAARSEWVKREWQIALESKGIQGINPVPIDPPEDAPPPTELSSLHFNDQHLAYIANFRSRQKPL